MSFHEDQEAGQKIKFDDGESKGAKAAVRSLLDSAFEYRCPSRLGLEATVI